MAHHALASCRSIEDASRLGTSASGSVAPMMQCKAGHSAIPAMALSFAWRESRNHPSASNTRLFSLMVTLWTCLSKSSTSSEGCRGPRQTPVALGAEPADFFSCWPPRLFTETSPQLANRQVPQSHMQLLQEPLLRRVVGCPRFLGRQPGPVPQSTPKSAHSRALQRSSPW